MNSFTPEIWGAACTATSATPAEAISALAPQSCTMYSSSPAVSFDEMQVNLRPARWAAHSTSK